MLQHARRGVRPATCSRLCRLPHRPSSPFFLLQYVKIAQFQIVLGLCGLATLWRAAAMPSIGGAAGLSIPDTTGDVVGIISVAVYLVACMA